MSDEEQQEAQVWRDEWLAEEVTKTEPDEEAEPVEDWQLYECSVTAD